MRVNLRKKYWERWSQHRGKGWLGWWRREGSPLPTGRATTRVRGVSSEKFLKF